MRANFWFVDNAVQYCAAELGSRATATSLQNHKIFAWRTVIKGIMAHNFCAKCANMHSNFCQIGHINKYIINKYRNNVTIHIRFPLTKTTFTTIDGMGFANKDWFCKKIRIYFYNIKANSRSWNSALGTKIDFHCTRCGTIRMPEKSRKPRQRDAGRKALKK